MIKQLIFTATMLATATTAAYAADAPTDTSASLICRSATASETANAQLTNPATNLVCKPFGIAMKMSDGSMHVIGSAMARGTGADTSRGPDISKALSPQQVNDAWVRYLDMAFRVDHSG